MSTEEQTHKKSEQISVSVVQEYSMQDKNQQKQKQLLLHQNRENKCKSTGPNSAIKT
jgi:hypothetical protein